MVSLVANATDTNSEVMFLNDLKITSLMRAVSNNDVDAVRIFLDNGSDINEKNIAGVSTVHMAVKNDSVEALRLLIDKNVNVNATDEEKFTPLMRACNDGNANIVKILIDAGASVWPENIFGETALFLATSSDCNECVKYITEKDYNHNGTKNSFKYRSNEIDKATKIAHKKQNKELEYFLVNYKEKLLKEINSNNGVNYVLDAKKISEKEFKDSLKNRYKKVLK